MIFFRHPLFRLVVTLVSLTLIVNLSRSIYSLWKKRDIVRQREEVLGKLKADSEELERKLTEAQSPEYVEKIAREKLGLAKEGETIVLVPNDKSTNLQMTNGEDKIQENEPNWKKWWKLFF